MTEMTNNIYEERMQLRRDLLAFKQPKRIPITARFSLEAACGLAGINLKEAMFKPSLVSEAMYKVSETFYTDACPFTHVKLPWGFQLGGSLNSVISSNGTIQHPEIENMPAEEYDAFIADPVTTIIENIQPRVLNSLKTESPHMLRIAALRGLEAEKAGAAVINDVVSGLNDKYGYMPGFIGGPSANIPFDYLADFLRGFKGGLIDLRRYPEKVKQANAVLFKIIKWVTNIPAEDEDSVSWFPLHMPAFMSTQQFEEFYYPDFEAFMKYIIGLGHHCNIFAEGNWDRYYGHLDRLPHYKTSFLMEEGDPVRIKETLGRHHFFGGIFDPTVTLVYDKDKCIDEVKRLIDICGKDGGFFFAFNKSVIDIKSVDVSKLSALLEYVRYKAAY